MTLNWSTGLGHSSDKEAAKRTLSHLKNCGHNLSPESIKKWAVKNGWKPKHAEELSKLASKYFV